MPQSLHDFVLGQRFHLQPSLWAYESRPANFHQGLSAQRKSRNPGSSRPASDLRCPPWVRAVLFITSWQGTSLYRISWTQCFVKFLSQSKSLRLTTWLTLKFEGFFNFYAP